MLVHVLRKIVKIVIQKNNLRIPRNASRGFVKLKSELVEVKGIMDIEKELLSRDKTMHLKLELKIKLEKIAKLRIIKTRKR